MIDVCFAVHDVTGTYSKYTAVAIASLLDHTEEKVRIHILHDRELPVETKKRFEKLVEGYSREVFFYCAEMPEQIIERLDTSHFTVGTLWRLMMADILPDYVEKVLYLDSDLLINMDVLELWKLDMQDNLVLGKWDKAFSCIAEELGIKVKKYSNHLMENGTLNKYDYINAGVMVMDLAGIRNEKKLFDESVSFFEAYPDCEYLDQDAINYIFEGRKGLLDERFNLYTRELREKRSKLEECIYHYSGDIPFEGSNECFDREFFRILDRIEWRDGGHFNYYDLYYLFRRKINSMIRYRKELWKNNRYRELCFFGAKETVCFKRIINELEEERIQKDCFFVDSNKDLWGKSLGGFDICEPEVLREKCGKCLVIVLAFNHFNEIADRLKGMGYSIGIDVINSDILVFERDIEQVIAL